MPSIALPQGTIDYRVAGPEDSTLPPVVFVHGLLVDGQLWTSVADRLATAGVRSYAPTWPLGAHRIPLGRGADLTPRGIARIILDFIAAQGLTDVTLVGNDTGGGLCQFLLDTDASSIGRVVLTNCDAFDQFPPPPFGLLVKAGRNRTALRMMALSTRPTALRHSLLGFGGLARNLDPAVTASWMRPLATDSAIRDDTARFMAGIDPRELVDVATRLPEFTRPVRIVWGDGDRFFKPALGERLARTFPAAQLVKVPGARTFLPLDEPDAVAGAVLEVGAT